MPHGGDEHFEFRPDIDAFAYPIHDDNTVVVLPWQTEHYAWNANMAAAAAAYLHAMVWLLRVANTFLGVHSQLQLALIDR